MIKMSKMLLGAAKWRAVLKHLLKGSMLTLGGRYYIGNSFYLGFGFGQRTADVDVKAHVTLQPTNGFEGAIKSKSLVLNISVGNTWIWDNGFFLGCDWIGYTVPVSSSSSGDISYLNNGAEDANLVQMRKDAKDFSEEIGQLSTPSLLILHLGFAF